MFTAGFGIVNSQLEHSSYISMIIHIALAILSSWHAAAKPAPTVVYNTLTSPQLPQPTAKLELLKKELCPYLFLGSNNQLLTRRRRRHHRRAIWPLCPRVRQQRLLLLDRLCDSHRGNHRINNIRNRHVHRRQLRDRTTGWRTSFSRIATSTARTARTAG